MLDAHHHLLGRWGLAAWDRAVDERERQNLSRDGVEDELHPLIDLNVHRGRATAAGRSARSGRLRSMIVVAATAAVRVRHVG